MKYGYIDFDLTVKSYWESSWNHKALLNIGDAVEYAVIKQLYVSLGIKKQNMVPLSIAQLTTYKGEKLIVALNIALDSYVGYNSILENLSSDIIPVFLGMSFTEVNLTTRQIDRLIKFAPIGCRDERSYRLMESHGIPCYLNGCTAAVYQNECEESETWRNKIVLIDVPYEACSFIPETIKNQIVFLSQEKYCCESEMEEGQTPSDWASDIMQVYASKPKLIITSRFHGAVLSIANDIPCIVTLEKNTFRFSWIKNWLPIYTEKTFDRIDWSKADKKQDFSGLRELMQKVAKTRIMEATFRFHDSERLTALQVSKTDDEERDSSNQVLYYRKVWNQIQMSWKPDRKYTYGFWGLNDNTEKLYSLIEENFPNAKLVSIYDMFKKVTYQGISSENPYELSKMKDIDSFYVIVTAYLASRVAEDIFKITGFHSNNSFLCKREFIEPSDLQGFGT